MDVASADRPGPARLGCTRERQRFAFAIAASLLLHLLLASEVPVGIPGRGQAPAPLTVRLHVVDKAADVPADAGRTSGEASPASAPAIAVRRRPLPENRSSSAPPTRSAGDDAAPMPGTPAYYAATELDVYPRLVAPLVVHYPQWALTERRAGRVVAVLLIDAAGRVAEVAVIEADPPGYFEAAARESFEATAFFPGRRNGVPVGSRIVVRLDFDPAGAARPAR